jgi:Uma2 family endonuclease
MHMRTTPPEVPADNPFCYGWRFVRKTLPDGREHLVQVPLTLEDVLHPKEGDVIPERHQHEGERGDLTRTLRSRGDRLDHGLVLSDCIIDWGIPGVPNHSPDISVFEGLTGEREPDFGIFQVAKYAARNRFVLELVSPHTRANDVKHKPPEYHQAGVPLYIVVDQKRVGGPRQVLAYRRTRSRYQKVKLDAQGRVLLEMVGLYLGLLDNRVVCWDAASGELLGDYTQEHQGRLAAEKESRKQARARRAAEKQAQQQAEARQAAEQRIAELEAELRRLRGGS